MLGIVVALSLPQSFIGSDDQMYKTKKKISKEIKTTTKAFVKLVGQTHVGHIPWKVFYAVKLHLLGLVLRIEVYKYRGPLRANYSSIFCKQSHNYDWSIRACFVDQ